MDLTRLTSHHHFYDFIHGAIIALAAFNIGEIIFLLVHKRRLERAEKRKELLKHTIAGTIISQEAPQSCLPPPATHGDYEAYAEAAASIIESFEGEVAARAAALVRALGVDLYYKRLYRNRTWYKRAHAVDTLAALKLKRNREFFSAMFRGETSSEVRYRLVYGLSTLVRGADDVRAIARMLASMPYLTAKFNEDIFFNAISTLKLAGREAEFGDFMLSGIADASIPPLVKRDCLSACHIAACEQAAPVVKAYYEAFRGEPEILIACIKSLVRMGETWMLPEALRHPDWRVRLVALKYAHLGAESCLQAARGLLRDANYHVRINAALALRAHGGPGLAALREELASSDKYAAAAARYGLDSARGRA